LLPTARVLVHQGEDLLLYLVVSEPAGGQLRRERPAGPLGLAGPPQRAVLLAEGVTADALFQLAEVAGPFVGPAQVLLHPADDLIAQPAGGPFSGDARADERHQQGEVFGAAGQLLPQRRRHDAVGAEAVVEVLAEA